MARSFIRWSWAAAGIAAACVPLGCGDSDESADGPGSGNTTTGASTSSGGTGAAASTSSSASSGSGGSGACGHAGDAEPAGMEGMTAAHNAVRCAADATPPIPPLAWSSAIAATAQAYADKLGASCDLTHSGNGYGENLFGGTGSYSAQDAVDQWAGEKQYFSYTTFPDSCSGGACGHYVQMVWRDSAEVGCGKVSCVGGGEVWVCDYDPPGNFVDEMPY